jgi:pimeloyl-ACP methyl ester carboxylesterase
LSLAIGILGCVTDDGEPTLVAMPDGRQLEVWMAGPVDGVPVVDHHGTPGCGRPDRHVVAAAEDLGVRLIRPTRPGYSRSDPRPGRDVAAVASDVAAVLDHLGVHRVAVMGESGGGPHALATAARLPDRVAAVATIAGVGPYGEAGLEFLAGMGQDNIDEFSAALEGEAPLRAFLEPIHPTLRRVTPEQIVTELSTLLPDVDRAVVSGELGEDLAGNFRLALQSGIEGWVDDDLAFTRPWGFDLREIQIPVTVWQGGQDLMVPSAHGEWLAGRLPKAKAQLLPRDGHLSIAAGRIREILTELASAVRA